MSFFYEKEKLKNKGYTKGWYKKSIVLAGSVGFWQMNESRDHLQTAAASHLAMEDKHRFVVLSPKFYVKKLAWKATRGKNPDVKSFSPGWESSASTFTEQFAPQSKLSACSKRTWLVAGLGEGSERAC